MLAVQILGATVVGVFGALVLDWITNRFVLPRIFGRYGLDHVLEEHGQQSSLPITDQKESDVSTDCPLVSTTEEHQPQSLFSSGSGKSEKGSSVPITA
ncbi:hypothetical protein [Rhodopirellula bahusiensis]|uniref:hypothetical protein n=1 Tax=Rhodopirellula bahusiensis TaxID=2014065 RepID=UPI00117A7382|nr:hypothetical protein [Rhodopirellula bahusiensis]